MLGGIIRADAPTDNQPVMKPGKRRACFDDPSV
jgi:hypothetical protein